MMGRLVSRWIKDRMLLLQSGQLTLHGGQHRGGLLVPGEVTAEVVALGAADLVMDGEVVLAARDLKGVEGLVFVDELGVLLGQLHELASR